MNNLSAQNNRKIFIGFKCNSTLKLTLCKEAENLGVTLSSHVETIVSNYNSEKIELENLLEEIFELQKEIKYYESPFFKEMFEKHKGKTLNYIDRSGKSKFITIEKIPDVFKLIIDSYKIEDE